MIKPKSHAYEKILETIYQQSGAVAMVRYDSLSDELASLRSFVNLIAMLSATTLDYYQPSVVDRDGSQKGHLDFFKEATYKVKCLYACDDCNLIGEDIMCPDCGHKNIPYPVIVKE